MKDSSRTEQHSYCRGKMLDDWQNIQKYGTIALIKKSTLVIYPMTQDVLLDKMISNIKEVKARRAVVTAIQKGCSVGKPRNLTKSVTVE